MNIGDLAAGAIVLIAIFAVVVIGKSVNQSVVRKSTFDPYALARAPRRVPPPTPIDRMLFPIGDLAEGVGRLVPALIALCFALALVVAIVHAVAYIAGAAWAAGAKS